MSDRPETPPGRGGCGSGGIARLPAARGHATALVDLVVRARGAVPYEHMERRIPAGSGWKRRVEGRARLGSMGDIGPVSPLPGRRPGRRGRGSGEASTAIGSDLREVISRASPDAGGAGPVWLAEEGRHPISRRDRGANPLGVVPWRPVVAGVGRRASVSPGRGGRVKPWVRKGRLSRRGHRGADLIGPPRKRRGRGVHRAGQARKVKPERYSRA